MVYNVLAYLPTKFNAVILKREHVISKRKISLQPIIFSESTTNWTNNKNIQQWQCYYLGAKF